MRRSTMMAARSPAEAGPEVVRVPTDGRTVAEIALDVLRTCGWLEPRPADR